MRNELGDDKFDYTLVCAKICGAAHYNMKIKVVVESKEAYAKWLTSQTAKFAAKPAEQAPPAAADSTSAKSDTTSKVSTYNR